MKEKFEIEVEDYRTGDGDYHNGLTIVYKDGERKSIGSVIVHSPNNVGTPGYSEYDDNYVYIAFTADNTIESVFDIAKRCPVEDKEKAKKLWENYLVKLSKGTESENKGAHVYK